MRIFNWGGTLNIIQLLHFEFSYIKLCSLFIHLFIHSITYKFSALHFKVTPLMHYICMLLALNKCHVTPLKFKRRKQSKQQAPPPTLWCVHVCVQSHFRCVLLFVTPWTVAHQTPLSIRFPRREYCCGLPCPSSGDLPSPGIEAVSPALTGGFFTTSTTGETQYYFDCD